MDSSDRLPFLPLSRFNRSFFSQSGTESTTSGDPYLNLWFPIFSWNYGLFTRCLVRKFNRPYLKEPPVVSLYFKGRLITPFDNLGQRVERKEETTNGKTRGRERVVHINVVFVEVLFKRTFVRRGVFIGLLWEGVF